MKLRKMSIPQPKLEAEYERERAERVLECMKAIEAEKKRKRQLRTVTIGQHTVTYAKGSADKVKQLKELMR